MNKRWLAAVDVAVMAVILAFVVIYSRYRSSEVYKTQVANFESTTVAMEQVTANYLRDEQRICDIWAHYINESDMTLEEAAEFVRTAHVLKNTSAHLIYIDTLTGVSTRPKPNAPNDNSVSYKKIDLLGNMEWIADIGEAVNVSRAFTNPISGEQSLAFVNKITVNDAESGGKRAAVLMRIVPLSDIESTWVFPQGVFDEAELSAIDSSGNYIIRGRSFKNSNFFEFYRSYNTVSSAEARQMEQDVITHTGSIRMMDSRGRECVIAYAPISASEGWVLLSYIPESSLKNNTENWLLISVVSLGLLVLFVLNIVYMQYTNKRLQQMAREAESANKAKTDFLSTMSHDIRTPMNAIIGLTTLAERNIGDQDSVKDNLRKISLACNHLLTLINDILDISKVESGKLNLSPVTFSIVESVENLVNISQPMVKEKNIDFGFSINRMEKEYLYADQLRLNQIYINILSNAIKYTQPQGKVSVAMREDPSEKDGCIKLTYVVADTGMGMSPEFMAKMYQPFSRQTDSRVNSIQGTGLGLAITKQMVDLMDGTIDCQSEPGKGTTFTIVLDIPVADKQLQEMDLGPIDVLIVDDDETLLQTASDSLESLGAHAETAADGLTALGMIRHRQETVKNYDVIILDWKMPGLDGVEICKRIREEIDDRVPILIISAYDWSDIEDSAKDAGANGFIGKPLFRSKLYEKISDLMGVQSKNVEPEDDYSDIAGMNILIAEDNDINWEIIQAMLEMFGITSERASNGRICVDMMKEAPEGKYDLIFMDVQMPEMNGLDAASAIRKLEDPWASGIPIIAMTADAFSENVAECLAVGMNGHIAKPVDIKLVIKEIRNIRKNSKQLPG